MMIVRPTVAHVLAADARQKNPNFRMAEVMAVAANQDLATWLQEASGDLPAEYAEFLLEMTSGLTLEEAMDGDGEPPAMEPVYAGDRQSCRVPLIRPLAAAEPGGDPTGELTLRRLTRHDVITELGPQSWTEPGTAKSLRIMALASGEDVERLRGLDFGDYLRLQGALQDFS